MARISLLSVDSFGPLRRNLRNLRLQGDPPKEFVDSYLSFIGSDMLKQHVCGQNWGIMEYATNKNMMWGYPVRQLCQFIPGFFLDLFMNHIYSWGFSWIPSWLKLYRIYMFVSNESTPDIQVVIDHDECLFAQRWSPMSWICWQETHEMAGE